MVVVLACTWAGTREEEASCVWKVLFFFLLLVLLPLQVLRTATVVSDAQGLVLAFKFGVRFWPCFDRRYFEPQPEWSLMREASFGHGELAFHEDGSADWLWHRNQDDESLVADAVRLMPHPMRVRSQEGLPSTGGPVMCSASK